LRHEIRFSLEGNVSEPTKMREWLDETLTGQTDGDGDADRDGDRDTDADGNGGVNADGDGDATGTRTEPAAAPLVYGADADNADADEASDLIYPDGGGGSAAGRVSEPAGGGGGGYGGSTQSAGGSILPNGSILPREKISGRALKREQRRKEKRARFDEKRARAEEKSRGKKKKTAGGGVIGGAVGGANVEASGRAGGGAGGGLAIRDASGSNIAIGEIPASTVPKRRRKKRKKGWIFLLIILLAAGGYYYYTTVTGGGTNALQVRYTEISRDDLKNVVSVRGNVQSVVKRNVYSTLTMMVKSVEAAVGDQVKAGQILCYLDKEDLELSIEQQKAELNASIQNSDKQIESNERLLSEAAENLESGSNAQILSAEASVKNAQVSLDTAQANYNNLLRDYNNGTNSGRVSAESSVRSAQNDLEQRERDYGNNKLLLAAGAITQEALNQSENAYNNAQTRLNDALTNLENAKTAESRALEQAANSLKSAQTAYNNAQTSLASARRAAQQEITRLESNVESSRIGANIEARQIALKKLEKQLADSVIKSPVSGVVTAVYAKEGSSGSGLLFIIEDPARLKINTRVKEYDAGKLQPGMPVLIKPDAVSGAEYQGKLAKIDPAAVKNSMGETDTMSDIEYGAEVSVDSENTKLRIGMNTRLDIIVERRENVFFVPFDAITQNGAGKDVIYIIDDVDEASSVAKEIPVDIGLETDFYIEIKSAGLKSGMRVINEASGSELSDGAPVAYQEGGKIRGGNSANRLLQPNMRFGGMGR